MTAESGNAYHELREPRKAHRTERVINPLSLPDLDLELERQIRDLAQREGLSVAGAAVVLLRRGAASLDQSKLPVPVGHALDRFIGSWPANEDTLLLDSITDCETST